MWSVPDTATLVGHALAAGAALACLDLVLTAIGLLPTYWARRRV